MLLGMFGQGPLRHLNLSNHRYLDKASTLSHKPQTVYPLNNRGWALNRRSFPLRKADLKHPRTLVSLRPVERAT